MASTVLVVEDDEGIALPLVRTLEREGYAVARVADGLTAVDRAARGDIDLIILDLGLPDIDGLEVCRRVRADGFQQGILILTAGGLIEQRVEEQLLPLVLLAIVMVAVAGLLGYLVEARLSSPFRELARAAGELGRGRFDLEIPCYSIPEAQAVGVAIRDSATKLDEMVHREREFAANASHQLRTPITALRLELEDLSMWPDTSGPVAKQLERAVTEVDRLSWTVNDLLDLARGRRIDALTTINLSALVADTVERWRAALAAEAGRAIEYDGRDVVPVRLAAGPISQILDVLIENALKHGSGTVTVEVAQPANYLRVSVRDEGRTRLGNDIFTRHVQSASSSGEGIGLAVATEIADAIGGHLALQPDERATSTLMLPRPQAGAG